MESGRSDKTLFSASLIALCVFSVIISLSLFGYLKNTEQRFKKEKAALVREKMDLRDQLDSLKADLKMKSDAISSLDSEKKNMLEELARIEKLAEELKGKDNEELESMRKRNQEFQKELNILRGSSAAQLINDAASRETDENVKRILSDAAIKIEMIREGKAVQLEPLVITEGGSQAAGLRGRKDGKIFAVNAKKNLIVVDIGRSNGAREGQRCRIIGEQGEIATATIIRTRYEISAAFVDKLNPKHTILDVKEGDKVFIER
jgi:cell division protein FtsB